MEVGGSQFSGRAWRRGVESTLRPAQTPPGSPSFLPLRLRPHSLQPRDAVAPALPSPWLQADSATLCIPVFCNSWLSLIKPPVLVPPGEGLTTTTKQQTSEEGVVGPPASSRAGDGAASLASAFPSVTAMLSLLSPGKASSTYGWRVLAYECLSPSLYRAGSHCTPPR